MNAETTVVSAREGRTVLQTVLQADPPQPAPPRERRKPCCLVIFRVGRHEDNLTPDDVASVLQLLTKSGAYSAEIDFAAKNAYAVTYDSVVDEMDGARGGNSNDVRKRLFEIFIDLGINAWKPLRIRGKRYVHDPLFYVQDAFGV